MIKVTEENNMVNVHMDIDTHNRILATIEDAIIYIDDPGALPENHRADFTLRLSKIQGAMGMTARIWEKRVHRYHADGKLYPAGADEQWDAEKVKRLLPGVPVEMKRSKEIHFCPVFGRKNKFATISLPEGGTIEAAWETVAKVLNRGSYIKQ